MSCETCGEDTLLQLVEILADSKGYRLVQKDQTYPDETRDENKVRLESMTTEALVQRYAEVIEEEGLVKNEIEAWQRAYDRLRLRFNARFVPYAKDYRMDPPETIRQKWSAISSELVLITQVVRERLSREALESVLSES